MHFSFFFLFLKNYIIFSRKHINCLYNLIFFWQPHELPPAGCYTEVKHFFSVYLPCSSVVSNPFWMNAPWPNHFSIAAFLTTGESLFKRQENRRCMTVLVIMSVLWFFSNYIGCLLLGNVGKNDSSKFFAAFMSSADLWIETDSVQLFKQNIYFPII